MGQDEFNKSLVVPMELGKRIIEEFPTEAPGLLSMAANAPPGVKKLILHIVLLQEHLRLAIDQIRKAQSVSDVEASMIQIRKPLDTVLQFKTDPDFQSLGQELFVNTGIITDIKGMNPGGAVIASRDILNSIWKQFQELSNINSKPIHTTTTRSTSSQNFEMKPKRAEAKFTLISTLCITNYLIDRIRMVLGMV
jgi:predicted methyltransferase